MRIFEVARSFYPSVGGLEKFVMERLNMYTELGFDFKLITTDFSSQKVMQTKPKYSAVYLKQYTSYNITPCINNYLSKNYTIFSINQIGRYFSDYSIRWAKKNGIKVLLTPHSLYHTSRYKIIKELIKGTIVKKGLEYCDKIICFTEEEKKNWIDINNRIEDKIVVIPHVYNPVIFNKSEIKDLGYYLYLGRFDVNKRVDILLESFEFQNNPQIKLLLTIDSKELPQKYMRFCNNPNIIFMGYVSEEKKIELLKNCSALVLPTEHEAFGVVLLEASNFTKPIICSGLKIIKDILDPRGVIYFNNDVPSLKEAFSTFNAKNTSDKQKMGMLNFNNLRNFSKENIYEKYKTLFHELNQSK